MTAAWLRSNFAAFVRRTELERELNEELRSTYKAARTTRNAPVFRESKRNAARGWSSVRWRATKRMPEYVWSASLQHERHGHGQPVPTLSFRAQALPAAAVSR